MTPCMEDWRKLSEFDFMVSRYIPTTSAFWWFSLSADQGSLLP